MRHLSIDRGDIHTTTIARSYVHRIPNRITISSYTYGSVTVHSHLQPFLQSRPPKRKRDTEQLNSPSPKRPRTSCLEPPISASFTRKAVSFPQYDVDSITHWAQARHWPQEYFDKSGEMSYLLARQNLQPHFAEKDRISSLIRQVQLHQVTRRLGRRRVLLIRTHATGRSSRLRGAIWTNPNWISQMRAKFFAGTC